MQDKQQGVRARFRVDLGGEVFVSSRQLLEQSADLGQQPGELLRPEPRRQLGPDAK